MSSMTRRSIRLAIAALPFQIAAQPMTGSAGFAALERDLRGELHVVGIDPGSGRVIGDRQNERFPFWSRFKTLLAAPVIARAEREPGLLDKPLSLPKNRSTNF